MASFEPNFDAIPNYVVDICRRLQESGFAAYVVGGGVRDLLLARPIKDWDLTTAAQPQDVQRLFRRTIPTGLKHGTVTVMVGEVHVEVTTFRTEGNYTDSRRPDGVTFVAEVDKDLERRDFTINAIAIDPVARKLVDPTGGCDDLTRRTIRAVGTPAERFAEDGLRPLRAIRIATLLDFTIDPATLDAIAGATESFRQVSFERIREELLRLLGGQVPSTGVQLLYQSSLLSHILPPLAAVADVDAELFALNLHVCDICPADSLLRLGALLGGVVDVQQSEQIAQRLKLSNREVKRLRRLVASHSEVFAEDNNASRRRLIKRLGPEFVEDALVLREALLSARDIDELAMQSFRSQSQALRSILAQRPALEISDLAINGNEVITKLGGSAGPRVGQVMRQLLEQVIDDPELNRRETLLALIDEL